MNHIIKIRQLLNSKYSDNININYLHKPLVLEWLFAIPIKNEKIWGQSLVNSTTNQWTTKLGEGILQEILFLKKENPRRITRPLANSYGKKLVPDFETDLFLYENKCRTYSTTGTAGEKILGTPIKYCECFTIYNKPLIIVCMAYQEYEAIHHFRLFNPNPLLKNILDFYKRDYNITFIKATDLVIDVYKNEL